MRFLALVGLVLICGVALFSSLRDKVYINELALKLTPELPYLSLDALNSDGVGSTQILYLRGSALLRTGDALGSITVLSSPVAQQRRPLSQWLLVQALIATDQTDRAAAELDDMHLDADVLVNLAGGLQPEKDRALIRLLAEQALREGGGSLATRRWLGLWSVANGDPAQSIEIIEPILTDPDHYLWSQLGWAHYRLQDYARAALAFEHALRIKPEVPLYRLRLAQSYQERNALGDSEKARRLLEDLVADDANANAEIWFTLGWSYYIAGDNLQAVMAFEKALEMSPNNSLYQMRLAQALVQRAQSADRERAISLLQRAVEQSPNLGEAVDLLWHLTQE